MKELLDIVGAWSAWTELLPNWVFMLLYGMLTAYAIGTGGFALARSGIKPLWVLLLMIPTANVAAFWIWAYAKWPAERKIS
ncbi:MAG: hypothetical protein WDO70_08100 [Alphaproteobacteria bacterium]